MAGYDPINANNPLKPRARGQFAPVPQPEPPQPPSQDGYPSGFARRAATVSRPDGSRVAAQTGALIQPVDGMVERPPTYAPAPNPDVPLAQPGGFMPQYVQDLQPRSKPSEFSAAPIVSSTPRPVADPNALPEGVTKRADNYFEGKGVHGEPVYSDTAFAPQFASVAGATGADQERFKNGYAGARGGGNMATEADAYEMARKAELTRAGEDYKAYVAAGSPRTKDGRSLSEYDFLQNQRQVGLEGFLDSNVGGQGRGRSDRSDLFGRRTSSDPKRDPEQADQIAAAEAQQSLAIGDVKVDEAVNKRADETYQATLEGFKANPRQLRENFGDDVTPEDAAALEYFLNAADSKEDPRKSRVGQRGIAVFRRKLIDANNTRGVFDGKRGTVGYGAEGSQLENFDLGTPRSYVWGNDTNTLQGPAFDKRDKSGTTLIDPNDPNAERHTTDYLVTGKAFGGRAAEALAYYKSLMKDK